ncbi:MAG: homoserine dehydrogenase, partial [Phycisphaerae bacterium]|nr:homoserine dehydrogenase [Phycisphaerae bacterium]
LGRNDISILSVLQHEGDPANDAADAVPVVITTHRGSEGGVRKAIQEVDALDVIRAPTVCIAIVDEYPEQI